MSIQTAILKLWGGPQLGLDGPSGHYVGPHGYSSTHIVIKLSPEPILGASQGFEKKLNLNFFSIVTE